MNIQRLIQQNSLRTKGFMIGLTLLMGVIGTFVSEHLHLGLTGTGVFLIVAGLVNWLAYYYSDVLTLKTTGAKPLTGIPDYVVLVQQMVDKAQLPMPRLYYIDSDAINAYATGRNPDKAVLVVTKGLLEKLTPEETASVVGHELAHIDHYDMRLTAVVSVLAGFIK